MPPAVIAGSASRPFGEALARALGTRLAASESKRFPDGEGYVRILENVAGQDVVVAQSTAPDGNLVELLLWLDAAREAGASHVTAVIPYMGYARQDRAFQPGEAVSSRAAAKAVAALADAVIVIDPHKEEALRFFGGKARSVTAVPQLAATLKAWKVDLVLAPDKGARDRAAAVANILGVPFDHLEKTRLSPTEVRMAPKDLDVAGRRVAIVDDLIASGATMLTAAKQLKDAGATAVFAACTHGLFTGNAAPRLLAGGIDLLFCTDTADEGRASNVEELAEAGKSEPQARQPIKSPLAQNSPLPDLPKEKGELTREVIYQTIRERPGVHKSELCRLTGYSWGTVGHHLQALREMGRVRTGRLDGKLHVAAADFGAQARSTRAMLLPHAGSILSLLETAGPLAVSDLQRELDLSPKVIRKHLQALVKDGLLADFAVSSPGLHPWDVVSAAPAAAAALQERLQQAL